MTTIFTGTITNAATVTSAVAQAAHPGPQRLTVQANFTYGSGGTSVDAYVQTSIDGGSTWIDIAEFSFTTSSARRIFNLSALTPVTTQYTATDGTLAANTAKDGVLGSRFRVKVVSVGTYAGGTTLAVDVSADGAITT